MWFKGYPYVGSTLDFRARERRWSYQLLHWDDAFDMQPLLVCAKAQAGFYEERAIRAYNSFEAGWNRTADGQDACRPGNLARLNAERVWTEDAKQRNAEAHKGKKKSADTLRKMRAAGRARMAAPEAKLKAAETCRARVWTPEMRAAVAKGNKGRVWTPAQLKRLKAARIRDWAKRGSHTEEALAKMRKATADRKRDKLGRLL